MIILLYCCVGGMIFKSLESAGEKARASRVTSLRNVTVAKLWNITDQFNVLYKENWTSLVSREIVSFQQQIIEAVKEGNVDSMDYYPMNLDSISSSSSTKSLSSSSPSSAAAQTTTTTSSHQQWSFPGAFLYSLSLITTMGE